MSRIQSSKLFLDALIAMGIKPELTKRVVIDIPARGVPIIYIEQYGDQGWLNVVHAMDNTETVISRETGVTRPPAIELAVPEYFPCDRPLCTIPRGVAHIHGDPDATQG
jgi:hypothetical protein